MTQNNSPRLQTCDNSLPTYEAATASIQPRNEVVLNVSDIVVHNERAPLIADDRSSTNRPSHESEHIFHDVLRQNALPAYYRAVNAPRNGQTSRCQTYKNIAAVILAMIAAGLTLFIILYGHENFNLRGF